MRHDANIERVDVGRDQACRTLTEEYHIVQGMKRGDVPRSTDRSYEDYRGTRHRLCEFHYDAHVETLLDYAYIAKYGPPQICQVDRYFARLLESVCVYAVWLPLNVAPALSELVAPAIWRR